MGKKIVNGKTEIVSTKKTTSIGNSKLSRTRSKGQKRNKRNSNRGQGKG